MLHVGGGKGGHLRVDEARIKAFVASARMVFAYQPCPARIEAWRAFISRRLTSPLMLPVM